MDYENFLELVRQRRSIRRFKTDPVPDEHVDKILEAARWAPSGANSQPWEFIVIKKPELRQRIIELINEQNDFVRKTEAVREPALRFHWAAPGFVRAPVWIIVCGDRRTNEAFPKTTVIQRGESHFTTGLASCFLYMTLAATTLGLGGQWVSGIALTHVQVFVKELLKVPKQIEFYDMLAVGYPDMQPRPRLVRERQEMVHYDGYDMSKFRTDEQIRDFLVRLKG